MKAVGLDAVEIERIASTLDRHTERFLEKVYTAEERRLADTRAAGGERPVEFYAGRFAAKEAVLKALGTGWAKGLGFHDIEVLREDDGRPHVVLHGPAAERARALGIKHVLVSITHTRRDAMAVALAE